jgi:hypothetical protein
MTSRLYLLDSFDDAEHPDMCGCLECQRRQERAHVAYYLRAQRKRERELNRICPECGQTKRDCECIPF